jgi:rhodanese-related sulfurtransferase
MKKLAIILVLFFVILFSKVFAQTDFKFDPKYQKIYPAELCNFLKANPKAVLIDVRSPGEYADTSSSGNLNIGHLKGSINISIDSIEKNLSKLKAYTDQPIVLYCSHSQRSRRVSNFLMDNGFTKVYNLNGGMSLINQAIDFPCKAEMIVSNLAYRNLPVTESLALIQSNKDILILDVRKTTEFEGIDANEGLNIGRIKNAINIPAEEVIKNLSKLPKDKTILVYDNHGAESSLVAKYLTENGYKNVNHMLGGMNMLIGKDRETQKLRGTVLTNSPKYTLLNLAETYNLLNTQSDLVILDVRTIEEFTNKAKLTYRNLGHLKNAIHITPTDFSSKLVGLTNYKKSTILVYGSENPAKHAAILQQNGFENVNLLYGNLFDLVSASFNIKNMAGMNAFLVDHEGLY